MAKRSRIEPVNGYAVIDRAWQPGDKVTLDLPMPVRRVVANEQVEADRGRVALMRGPLVFCVEGADVDGGKVSDLVLPDDAPLGDRISQRSVGRSAGDYWRRPTRRRTGATAFTAIPYYAWANRGKGEMAVWLARTADAPVEQ